MATFDLEALTAPVEPDDPCGPDLDLAGDSDYLNFVAGTEGRLPLSYFDGKDDSGAAGRPFQFSKVDVDGIVAAARPLLGKTRDIRLMFLLSKVCLLGRELGDFITLVRAIAAQLGERWDAIHPRPEDGDLQARMVALESIDAQPTVIMPLQFAPLIVHRRLGAVSFRTHLIATGAMPPRDGEDVIDASTIDKVIAEAELSDMVARRGEFMELQGALNQIQKTWTEKADSGVAVDLGKIIEIVGRIVVFLDDAVKLRDPSAGLVPPEAVADGDAEQGEAGDGPVRVGRVTNVREANAVLTAVADYFARREPSSPTLLLVRQANQLLGKSFIEVMRVLVPNYVEVAAIDVGRTESFALPVERLSASAGESEPAPMAEEPETTEAPADVGEASAGNGEAPAENNENVETAASRPAIKQALTTQAPVRTRAEALAHLDMVAAYFRAAEPSSPIPFLIERARDLAQRDFLSVLKAILPADTLKNNSN